MTAYFVGSADIRVPLPRAHAMTLFTPEGERSWAGKDGWDPHYPVASRTADVGAVFTTRDAAATTVWVVVDHGPHSVRYARVTPEGLAGTVEVCALSETPAGTDVRVTYDLTALTDDARDQLTRFASGYHAEIRSWADAISESLAGLRAACSRRDDAELQAL